MDTKAENKMICKNCGKKFKMTYIKFSDSKFEKLCCSECKKPFAKNQGC